MPKRRSLFPHRYTTVHLHRDGKRVPFVRLSGRWLEAFGFEEGAKFAAVGAEGGLLVLVVYEAAPNGRASGLPLCGCSMLRMIQFRRDSGRDLLAPLLALRSSPC